MLIVMGRRTAIDEEHDRRLEALRRMDRHHPHLVAALVHLALDFGRGGLEAGEKRLEAGRPRFLTGQAIGEKFIEHVARLVSEAADQLRPRAGHIRRSRQDRRVKVEYGAECRPVGIMAEDVRDALQAGIALRVCRQGRPQRNAGRAALGQRVERILIEVEDRALEKRR